MDISETPNFSLAADGNLKSVSSIIGGNFGQMDGSGCQLF